MKLRWSRSNVRGKNKDPIPSHSEVCMKSKRKQTAPIHPNNNPNNAHSSRT